MIVVFVVALLCATTPTLTVQEAPAVRVDPLHKPFDELLDLYVRDGFVYYNAIRADRARLDRYVVSLDGPTAAAHARGTREQQLALWINAYNAMVLKTVAAQYPIRGRSPSYPPNSIRQVAGAFEKLPHRVAGRTVTLDQIEKEILPPLGEPRAFLALGRGSIGGGRLRSEAYDADRLETQLAAVAAESMRRREMVHVDVPGDRVTVSPIFSWREAVFVASLADKAPAIFNQRSPLERAILGLIHPHLLGSEVEFLQKNGFKIVFHDFDWRLNDLSNRPPDGNF